jgi:dTDP-4-dehydrorhamnose 3,5-epimerase
MKSHSFDVIDPAVRSKIYTQAYKPKDCIEGVSVIELQTMIDEEGDFSELMLLKANGESALFPGFVLRQINRSAQNPGSVKAWHLHLLQDEVWFVSGQSHLLIGLWDIRAHSKSRGITMRIPAGGSSGRMVYIPRGVAHGSVNMSDQPGVIIYFINNHFDKDNPDEHRLPWDSLGTNFWLPQRD